MFDEELAGIVNFTDETAPKQMPVMEHKNDNANYNTIPNAEKRIKRVAEDCNDCPFTKQRSMADRIANSAKWGCICGAISMMLWWYEVNGMMDMEAAYPWIIVCALLAGFGVGKNVVK